MGWRRVRATRGRTMSFFRRLPGRVPHSLRCLIVLGIVLVSIAVMGLLVSARLVSSSARRMSRSPMVWVVEVRSTPKGAAPRNSPGAAVRPWAFERKSGAEALGVIYASARSMCVLRVECLDEVPEGLTTVRVGVAVVCHVF